MEYGKMMEQAKDNAKLAFYQNPGYQLERRERKSFILKVVGGEPGVTIHIDGKFNLTLHEPLIIDRLSDIYLENFTTFHGNGGLDGSDGKNYSAFVLRISEFNHQGNSTDQVTFNSLIIPNEYNTTVSAGRKIHKGKKLNYVASVNPSTLSNISGTITGLSVDTKMFGNGDMFLAEFVIVARD